LSRVAEGLWSRTFPTERLVVTPHRAPLHSSPRSTPPPTSRHVAPQGQGRPSTSPRPVSAECCRALSFCIQGPRRFEDLRKPGQSRSVGLNACHHPARFLTVLPQVFGPPFLRFHSRRAPPAQAQVSDPRRGTNPFLSASPPCEAPQPSNHVRVIDTRRLPSMPAPLKGPASSQVSLIWVSPRGQQFSAVGINFNRQPQGEMVQVLVPQRHRPLIRNLGGVWGPLEPADLAALQPP